MATEAKIQPIDDDAPPLREQVYVSLQQYFAELDGQAPNNLYQMVLQEIEVPLLQIVLYTTGGNQSEAAKLLGINRGTLRKKLEHYNID